MKKIILLISLLLTGLLSYYLWVQPHDYLVTLEARTFPGTINQSIKAWSMSMEDSEIEQSTNVRRIDQRVNYNDSTFLYEWHIDPINDSTSLVKIYVTDLDHSLMNRLTFPFFDTDFEKRVKQSMTDFNENLKEHISRFRVTIEGDATIEETFCACVSIEGPQAEKALGMMKNYTFLSGELLKNKVELAGRPVVSVTNWDIANDHIQYDFCYPIKQTDSLFNHVLISFKKIAQRKAVKAIYNGNYITSDRAWYALIDYAHKNDLNIELKPFEVFHNNPNMGGDELQWTTEVYMPLSE